MLKESIKRKLTISFLTLIVLLLIYLVPSENKDEKILFEPITENIVYLLNNDLLVQTKIVGNNDNIDTMIKDIIDSLTVNGTKKYYLKNGYKAILPSNTTLWD